MSSSSSSASTPAPVKGTSTTYSSTSSSSYASSSSVSSWAVLKSDAEEDHVANNKPSLQPQPPAAMSSITSMDIIHQPSDHNGIDDVSCMDVMETFGYMDLMNPNSEIWDDPSSIFENAENPSDFQQFHQQLQSPSPSSSSSSSQQIVVECGGDVHEGETSEDLAMVFFEWLKKNKESISAEDLRNVRLKRSTIESAAKRLGGGKEGMKQLLKLVLEWVQNHQLHKGIRRMVPNPCFSPSPLNIPHQSPPQPPPYVIDGMASGPGFPSMVGYMGDPPINSNPYVFDSAVAWPPSPMAMPSPPPQDFSGDGNQCTFQQFPGKGEKLVRLGSSATKEARQKRMARQRRFLSHHHRHNQQQYQIAADQQATLIGSDNCTNAAAAQTNPANWVYWPSATVPVSPSPPVLQQPDDPVQSQSFSWSDL